ncbi:hypothetical protein [Paenibacillus sp. 1P07SE]|uniref:hypothetical protein n=1 Tax=Paenibacillus sp. 1P07SE TaxID=3132209 RepID=UPI0039A71110
MRVPQFERFTRSMYTMGVLAIGIVIGAAIFNGIYHYQLSALYQQIGELGSEIDGKAQEIEQLTRFKDSHTVIKTIQVFIEEEKQAGGLVLDSRTQTELKRRVTADLRIFIGRSIYEIDSEAKLARVLLDHKLYLNVYEKDYSLEIKTMLVVDNELKVWVKVSRHSRS